MCWTTYDRRHNADRHAVFDMPRDHLVALLESDELAEATVSVVGGGEPFLYPLIEDVLRLAPSERRRLMIMTNGTLLHKRPAFWEVAERARLSLMFSIDAASAATYEDVRRPGRWSVMLANLERCLEVRERNPELLIQTSFVVLRRNLHEVMDFMRLNARWRSTYVHFHAAMRGSYPDAWRVDPLDPAFARVMREALEFAAAHGIALDRPEELLAGVEEAASAPPADSRCSCRLHSEAMTVAHLGDVFVCDTAFRAGYRCGNVFRDGLRGAWESPAWTSLRRAHREGVPERHPLCRNCLLVR